MENLEITLNKIRNKNNLENSFFLGLYKKLLLGDTSLSENEKFYLLKIAVYFLNSKDQKVEQLGYRIILMYSNQFIDYEPIYDVALSREYIPITKFIENKYFNTEELEQKFSNLYVSAFQENFKIEGDHKNLYRSKGQLTLNKFSSTLDNIAIVAPTSYGKSEMIFKKIAENLDKKICIIVPSKALLSQTKRALLKNSLIKNHFKKIITHPDMFRSEDQPFLSVLTQERLLVLLQKNKSFSIDLVLVDEAHNILENSVRAHLLAQVLLILQKRKKSFLVNFFTPFLMEVKNLNVLNHNIEIKQKPIEENMKVERYYAYDVDDGHMFLYDQFLNQQFNLESAQFETDIDFILYHKALKNIIYLNRPMKAEEVALKISEAVENIIFTEEIQRVINSISELIHPNYNLIKCIKRGVVYHHGGIPDIIRLYIEDIFSKYPEFKFIVTTSTLLEGVNIPAEKIFLLTPTKTPGYLTASQFKNLIGRVCRFKEVFNIETGDLKMLEPKIYLIKGQYAPNNFSLLKFYRDRVNSNKQTEDNVKNPLLVNSTNQEDRKSILEYLENMESGSSGLSGVVQPESPIGKMCFENNIYDFNILENETILITNLERYRESQNEKINSADSLMAAIASIFFENIVLSEKSENVARLKEQKTRNFYAMFISWRTKGSPYPLMINNFLRYWKKRESGNEPLIYVGSKWGDETRDGHQKLFVDISKKNEVERVNLAIAKTKEEQEFVDFYILKYVEILKQLDLVQNEFYDEVKYGTSDKKIICMLKNGFSMDFSRLLRDKYLQNIEFDFEQDSIMYTRALISSMKENNENEILVFEAENNL